MTNFLEWIIICWEKCWLNVLLLLTTDFYNKERFSICNCIARIIGWMQEQSDEMRWALSCRHPGGLVIFTSLNCRSGAGLCVYLLVGVLTFLLSPHLLGVSQCRPVKISQQFWQKLISVKTRWLYKASYDTCSNRGARHQAQYTLWAGWRWDSTNCIRIVRLEMRNKENINSIVLIVSMLVFCVNPLQ